MSGVSFTLYHSYITEISNLAEPLAHIGLYLKRHSKESSSYKRLLKLFLNILKQFYQQYVLYSLHKKTRAGAGAGLIRQFSYLTGRVHTADIFCNTDDTFFWKSRRHVKRRRIQAKKGLFKLKLLLTRLFCWLYGQFDINFMFGRKLHKSVVDAYRGHGKLVYKKNFMLPLLSVGVLQSVKNVL